MDLKNIKKILKKPENLVWIWSISLLLILINLSACELSRSVGRSANEDGVNLCVTNIVPYYLTDKELQDYSKPHKINMVKTNCFLEHHCGYENLGCPLT